MLKASLMCFPVSQVLISRKYSLSLFLSLSTSLSPSLSSFLSPFSPSISLINPSIYFEGYLLLYKTIVRLLISSYNRYNL